MAGMAAGEAYTPLRPGWRQDSDLDVVNPNNQKSLAGGWYTGPGLSKFTYPQVCTSPHPTYTITQALVFILF